MLGLIVRGVFLIGILTWYSTSVWKLIDGYFRDQFKSYLEEEYRKNPRMKPDAQTASTVDKLGHVPTTPRPETTLEPLRDALEAERAARRAAETAETEPARLDLEQPRVTGGTSENEAAGGPIDKNAFLGTAAESGLESSESSGNGRQPRPSVNQDDRDLERQGDNDRHRSAYAVSKNSRKRVKYRRKSADGSRENELPAKRTVKVTTLNDRDLRPESRIDGDDDDFWEFEEEADGKEPVEGILVSKLPFKPRTDIGDLERVTADEYCPLSLEDEASCDQVYKWP